MTEKIFGNDDLILINRSSGPDFAAFAAADEAKMLRSSGLDGNSVLFNAHDGGQRRAHTVDVRGQFGPLKGYGDIGIANLPAAGGNHIYNGLQQLFAVYALPLIRRIREMLADVSKSQAAKQGIAQCVDSDIAV